MILFPEDNLTGLLDLFIPWLVPGQRGARISTNGYFRFTNHGVLVCGLRISTGSYPRSSLTKLRPTVHDLCPGPSPVCRSFSSLIQVLQTQPSYDHQHNVSKDRPTSRNCTMFLAMSLAPITGFVSS